MDITTPIFIFILLSTIVYIIFHKKFSSRLKKIESNLKTRLHEPESGLIKLKLSNTPYDRCRVSIDKSGWYIGHIEFPSLYTRSVCYDLYLYQDKLLMYEGGGAGYISNSIFTDRKELLEAITQLLNSRENSNFEATLIGRDNLFTRWSG